MTLEGAINYLVEKRKEYQKWIDITPNSEDTYPDLCNYANAIDLSIAALRAKQEAERNEPLTLDELREMDGEPYWHVGLQEESPEPHWAILPSHVARCPQDYFYGRDWLAYRRKPEEEAT